jgi:hypothetical protein
MTVMQVEFSSPESWCKRLGNFQPIRYVPSANPHLRGVSGLQVRSDVAVEIEFHDALSWLDAAEVSTLPVERTRRATRNSTWALHVVALMFGLLLVASVLWVPLASAQMGGGMGGGHGGHGGQPGGATQSRAPGNNPPQHAPNPLRAILMEAHNLRADLMLSATQIEPWAAMEDALRNCIELNRSRMPEPNTGGNLDPLVFAQDYADNEHALAEASAKFVASMKSAMAALNQRQRQTSMDRFAAAIATETAPTVAQ